MADKWEASKEAGDFFQGQIKADLPHGISRVGRPVAYQPSGLLTRSRHRLSNSLLDFQGRLANALSHEVDTGSPFNLIPVFLGIGIAIYFTAPREPNLFGLLASFALFFLIALRMRFHGRTYFVIAAISALFAGMSLAKMATIRAAAPQVERQWTGNLTGLVLAVEQNRRGSPRYLVRVNSLENTAIQKTPKRLRLSAASKHKTLVPGESIGGLIRIQPVSGPAYPGGYDFSFFAWFDQLGGSGFFMGAPVRSEQIITPTLGEQAVIVINRARLAIEERIISALPNESGDIAVALITGNRTRISSETQNSLRNSGLAHILAISGLHMALVTLTVVWLVRGLFSLFPAIVLRYPVKKWAICTGFVAASLYLGLSGAAVATQRAWIMISVMLLAALMDRRAITMRSVSISAILILIVNPQSLLSPGFQMSFAAVASLVAGYEMLNRRRRLQSEYGSRDQTWIWLPQFLVTLGKYFGGIGLTSLIAGSATGLFAAWHFHQIATLGLLGNLLAMPIVALAVMPLALFSMLLMPYGFESLALYPMSLAIEQVISISTWVEGVSLPGQVGMQPTSFLLLGAGGLVILTLLKSRIRLIGLAVLALLPLIAGSQLTPDILVSENGRAIAIKTGNNQLQLLYPRRNKFISDIWLKAWSNGLASTASPDFDNCDRERCIVQLQNGMKLHVVYDPELLKQSCLDADILVAPRLWWVNCKGKKPQLVLKRWNFEQYGTHALYLEPTDDAGSKFRTETALSRLARPWHRRVTPKQSSFSDTVVSSRPVSPGP